MLALVFLLATPNYHWTVTQQAGPRPVQVTYIRNSDNAYVGFCLLTSATDWKSSFSDHTKTGQTYANLAGCKAGVEAAIGQ